MTAPRLVARAFVERTLLDLLADALDLTARHLPAYAQVEAAVRTQQNVDDLDLEQLQEAVRVAAPKEAQPQVASALRDLVAAHVNQQEVVQQTAYLIGVAVGQSLSRRLAQKVGAR